MRNILAKKHSNKLIDIIDTTGEPNVLQTMKFGNTGVIDNKSMLKIIIDKSIIEINGGEEACIDKCILLLKKDMKAL